MGYDINEVYQSNSDFLKAEDIGTNFWTATISGVEMKQFDNGERKLALSFAELDKSLLLNMTNARTVGDLYGGGTDHWIGKQVMLFTMPVEYQGKKVQAIRVRAPAQQQAMPPRQPGQMQPQANMGHPAQNSPQRPLEPAGGYSELNPPPPTSPADYGGI